MEKQTIYIAVGLLAGIILGLFLYSMILPMSYLYSQGMQGMGGSVTIMLINYGNVSRV